MGDRARAKWAKMGAAVPLSVGEVGPHLTQCRLGEAYLRTRWHPNPFNRLATIHQRHRQTYLQHRQRDRQRCDSIG